MAQRTFRTLGGLVLLGAAVAGCTGAAAGVLPSDSVTTAIQGWEHWFRLDWAAQAKPAGSEIDGYIYNNYGASASNVQILAQGLDGAGNVVSQKIAWVQGTVPGFNRAYFRVAGLAPTDRYRVSVWAFEFVRSPSAPQR